MLATLKRVDNVIGLGDRKKKPPKDAFTIYDFIEFSGMSTSGAFSALKRKVDVGEIKSGKFFSDGKWVIFYWL